MVSRTGGADLELTKMWKSRSGEEADAVSVQGVFAQRSCLTRSGRNARLSIRIVRSHIPLPLAQAEEDGTGPQGREPSAHDLPPQSFTKKL
jgi:hypothetical protein